MLVPLPPSLKLPQRMNGLGRLGWAGLGWGAWEVVCVRACERAGQREFPTWDRARLP